MEWMDGGRETNLAAVLRPAPLERNPRPAVLRFGNGGPGLSGHEGVARAKDPPRTPSFFHTPLSSRLHQAPLQNRAPGWTLGSKGCYDAPTLASLQAAVRGDIADFAAGNAAACLAQPIPGELSSLLASETARADADGLALLMADHTANDWRPTLKDIPCEALIVIGARSDIFPPEGCSAVAGLMPAGRTAVVTFRAGGHWLYLEQPAEFGDLVAAFAVGGVAGVEGWGDVEGGAVAK